MPEVDVDAQLGAWPYAPGQGPFRARGRVLIGHQDFIRDAVPGGLEAVRAQLRPATRGFYDSEFIATGWYDVAPLIESGLVCARLTGRSFDEYVRYRSGLQVAADMKGFYGFLAKLVTPAGAAVRMAKAIAMFLDFIDVRVRARSARRLEMEIDGVPELLVLPWLRSVLTGYAAGLTKHVRASHLDTRLEPIARLETRNGLSMLRCLLVVDYTERPALASERA